MRRSLRVISDVEAKRIADDFAIPGNDEGLALVAKTGEITATLAATAADLKAASPGDLGSLHEYIAHHGPRSAVAGWEAL